MSRLGVARLLLASSLGMAIATVWTQVERDQLLPTSVIVIVLGFAAWLALLWVD